MNAQELADYFEYELKDVFPYCILTIRTLREQADRIAELEQNLSAHIVELELHKAMIQDLERKLNNV